MEPITLITLSREYGAGAGMLAATVGARLGWRVVNEEIAPAVARRLGVPDDALVEWDEHAPTLLERIGQALIMGNPELLIDPEVVRQPAPADVARVTRELLAHEAARPPVIIVGHGAQAIFHDRPGTLHLRLVAPLEARLERICARRGCDQRAATELAHRLDTDRARYVREFFGRDVRDPLLYHLQINTGIVAIEETASMLTQLVEARRRSPA